MAATDDPIAELNKRRARLSRSRTHLADWQRLRRDVFTALVRERHRLVNQQRAWVSAMRDGTPLPARPSAAQHALCRELREMLNDVDGVVTALVRGV